SLREGRPPRRRSRHRNDQPVRGVAPKPLTPRQRRAPLPDLPRLELPPRRSAVEDRKGEVAGGRRRHHSHSRAALTPPPPLVVRPTGAPCLFFAHHCPHTRTPQEPAP